MTGAAILSNLGDVPANFVMFRLERISETRATLTGENKNPVWVPSSQYSQH